MQTQPTSTEHGPQVVSSGGSADPLYFCIEWNAENQLTRVTKNAVEQARFKYDPVGRRVEKVAGGLTTSYAYDEDHILRHSAGTTARYIHGSGIDEPLATEDGSALSYFQADALGSIVKTTSPTGAVTLTKQYDTWGGPQAGASGGFAFTGREWDPEIGLFYYRARYYDPKVGVFISEDPIGYVESPHLRSYVGNAPVNYTDPSGLIRWTVWERVYERGGILPPGQTGWRVFRIVPHCIEVNGRWNLEFEMQVVMRQFVPSGHGRWARYIRRHEDWHRSVQRENLRKWASNLSGAEGLRYCSAAACEEAAKDTVGNQPDYDEAMMKDNMDFSTRFKRFFTR